MKVVRIVVFEGSEDGIAEQLARSLPDGSIRESRPRSMYPKDIVNIQVLTVRPEDTAKLGQEVDLLRGYINKAVDWQDRKED